MSLTKTGGSTDPLEAKLLSNNGSAMVKHSSGRTVNEELLLLDNNKGYSELFGNFLKYGKSLHGAGKSFGVENSLFSLSTFSSRNKVIDVDISSSSDNIPILMHDLNATPVEGLTGNPMSYTLAQLRGARVTTFDNTPYQGTNVTTWDECMQIAAKLGNMITAELKNVSDNALQSIRNSIYAHLMKGRVIIQSLNTVKLLSYRSVDPTTPVVLLVYDGMPTASMEAAIAFAKSTKYCGINADINYSRINELVQSCADNGIALSLWTARYKWEEYKSNSIAPGVQISCDYTE